MNSAALKTDFAAIITNLGIVSYVMKSFKSPVFSGFRAFFAEDYLFLQKQGYKFAPPILKIIKNC